jgi:geranylgeranyl reductase family protein
VTSPIRVILADDHAVVRTGIRTFLESTQDIQVVAEADDGPAAHRQLPILLRRRRAQRSGDDGSANRHGAIAAGPGAAARRMACAPDRRSRRLEKTGLDERDRGFYTGSSIRRVPRARRHMAATTRYDVIIAGSGPAGATAAYFLGRERLRVLVLDRASLPRYKACGGGLSEHVLRSTFPFPFDPVIETRVSRALFIMGRHTLAMPLGDQAVCMVMRDRFDSHILAHAQAEVRPGEAVRAVQETDDRVTVETRTGARYVGRYLIGADGANSVVARGAGLPRGRRTAAAIEAEVPAPPHVLAWLGGTFVFLFGEVPMGYLWIFPKAAHLSVGIGSFRPRRGELQAALRRVMARYDISLDGVRLHGHPIPVYLGAQPVVTKRILLVGDAAGLADPLTGEGIRPAIKSGRMAAEAILSGNPARYAVDLRNRIGRSQSFGLALAWLFYHFPAACLALGAPNPYVTQALADILADRIEYPRALARIFGTLPYYLAAEALAGTAGFVGGQSASGLVRRLAYAGLSGPSTETS